MIHADRRTRLPYNAFSFETGRKERTITVEPIIAALGEVRQGSVSHFIYYLHPCAIGLFRRP